MNLPTDQDYKRAAEKAKESLKAALLKIGVNMGKDPHTPCDDIMRAEMPGAETSVVVQTSINKHGYRGYHEGVSISYEYVGQNPSKFGNGLKNKTVTIKRKADPQFNFEKIAAEIKAGLEFLRDKAQSEKESEELTARMQKLADKELPDPDRVFDLRQRDEDGTYKINLSKILGLRTARLIQSAVLAETKGAVDGWIRIPLPEGTELAEVTETVYDMATREVCIRVKKT